MFRGQAIAAHTRLQHGWAHIFQPWRDSVPVVVAMVLVLAFGIFCGMGQLTRKASIVGVLTHPAGTVSMRARDAGQVAEVRVQEGDHVNAGDLLVVIDTEHVALARDGKLVATAEDASASIRARAAQLESEKQARSRFYAARVRSAEERAVSLARQMQHAQAEIDSLRQRGDLANAAARRLAALADEGFVPTAQVQASQDAALDASSRLEAARRAAAALASDRASAATEAQSLRQQMMGELAALQRSIESSREEALQNATRQRLAITAPADGTVSALQLSHGQTVQPGEQLLDFLPDADNRAERGGDDRAARVQVQLFASGRTVGFVKPGQVVNVRFEAFPFQKFGMFKGKVAAVSRTPYAPAEIPQSVAAREPMYRVVVELDAGAVALRSSGLVFRPGMPVAADVLLETRAIWEWALEPLIAIHHKT